MLNRLNRFFLFILDEERAISNLRKIIKSPTCYEDIYFLALAITKKRFIQPLEKMLTVSKTAQNNQSIPAFEKSMLDYVAEILSTITHLKNDNKELNEKIVFLKIKR